MFGLLQDSLFQEHDTGTHPERSERLSSIRSGIEAMGDSVPFFKITPERADLAAIARIHTPDYIQWVRQQVEAGMPRLDPDTAVCPKSYDIALHAVGGSLAGIDAIIAKTIKQAFFLVRPPGHHAEADTAMGFCLFNNIAIAARHLIEHHGLSRVAIFDFDVHHGNGTMHAFYDDPAVFYGSVHQWPFFPGTGRAEETGTGAGLGSTLNIPHGNGAGDDEYEEATQRFADAMDSFKPEFLLLSAGYDGHWSDPLAGHQLTERGYTNLVKILAQTAKTHTESRIALFLEGGYNLSVLRNCVPATINTIVQEL
jgi:acetoin utilization deacetylase AcuC-like enzyme